MQIGEHKLVPSNRICEKLFACKGPKIFSTDLVYEFNTNDLVVLQDKTLNKLSGKIIEVLDYGIKKYSKVDLGCGVVTVEYAGQLNEEVVLDIDVDKITIIDKSIDIIIV